MDLSDPEQRAFQLLALVNDWLRYSELKNGALLTICSAAILGLHEVVDLADVSPWIFWWVICATLAAALSSLVMLLSFYARINIKAFDPIHEFVRQEKI